ncbi:MAG: ribosomal protein S18-alanine N-acetyltransferase [Syntrophobacteraceae bacterium]
MAIDLIISPLKKTDIPAILEIETRSQFEPWSEQSFLEELGRIHSYLFVARLAAERAKESGTPLQHGGIVGYLCYWCVADELQILNFAVHPDFRRLGIARQLLAHALDKGCEKKARTALLEVRGSNDSARRLYESFGFRVVGERPDYYGIIKEPAILMELDLIRNEA